MKQQRGWTGVGALAVVLSAAIGALLAHYLVSSFDQSTPPVVQWGLLTVFLLPIGFATHLWVNLNSLRETKGLSGSERRRIRATVAEKVRQVQIALGFYMVSAVIIAFGLWFSPSSWKIYHLVTIFTGMSLGMSVSSFFLILQEWKEISNFKGKIHERSSRNKQLAKKLEALSPKGE
jgi:MFS family permease